MMRIEAIAPGQIQPFRAVNALAALQLTGIPSLEALLVFLEQQRAADPALRVLCTLDDLGQCGYTSMHASMDDRIYLEEHDVEDESPAAEHARALHRLAHVAAVLDADAHRVDWTALAGTLECNDADIDALAAMNAAPDAVLDDEVHVLRVPVARDDLLIAGLPNGYFRFDWDIFQNHALARRLQDAHGYRLFGIGASWLGFVGAQPLAAAAADALVADLRLVYGPAGSEQAWQALATAVRTRRTLLLGYTGNFAERD
ncbi:hypothetical protein [Xanthomonas sp. XNM01]|uniref:hypothetical protein n=1 Tax=Xanthomonas sp. XNM01 TaxID=2769289 RepID=UPI001CE0F19A|nr:hypothetical protein [Xanthomonas sp. XNM01]